MDKMKTSKAIALVSTALLIASLFWLLNTKRVNVNLTEGLNDQRLKSESLLSQKLLLEKDIEKLKTDLGAVRGQNEELDRRIESTLAKIKGQQAEYNRMKKQNLSLGQLKKQKQELIALQHRLENEMETLRQSYVDLQNKNRLLTDALALSEDKNRVLSDDLSHAMLAAIDQSQIQAVRGKSNRLTAKAKRTQKLVADFELAADLRSVGFRISDPKGNVLSQDNGTISFTTTPADDSYVASSGNGIAGNKIQKIHLSFSPTSKLKPGVYTIEVLNENLHVSSLKVKLK
jgi:hypothetical protein